MTELDQQLLKTAQIAVHQLHGVKTASGFFDTPPVQTGWHYKDPTLAYGLGTVGAVAGGLYGASRGSKNRARNLLVGLLGGGAAGLALGTGIDVATHNAGFGSYREQSPAEAALSSAGDFAGDHLGAGAGLATGAALGRAAGNKPLGRVLQDAQMAAASSATGHINADPMRNLTSIAHDAAVDTALVGRLQAVGNPALEKDINNLLTTTQLSGRTADQLSTLHKGVDDAIARANLPPADADDIAMRVKQRISAGANATTAVEEASHRASLAKDEKGVRAALRRMAGWSPTDAAVAEFTRSGGSVPHQNGLRNRALTTGVGGVIGALLGEGAQEFFDPNSDK